MVKLDLNAGPFQAILFTVTLVPREESFPILLKIFDVTRTTHTSLEVMLEKNTDDYWNFDGDRQLSDTWTGSQGSQHWTKKPPDGYTWSWGRLTRKQTTSRPDTLWSEIWKDMSEASKRKEKWTVEKTEACRCKKIAWYLLPMPAAMACKTRREKYRETCSIQRKCKTTYACIVEADGSSR